jgi:CheY-like chemotaxis protein
MRANPGGLLDPDEIVGRDGLIASIWNCLDLKSVRLEAERRIGKTSILRKMLERPAKGWVPVFMDLEQAHSAEEFAELVSKQVHQYLSSHQRMARRLVEFLRGCSDAEVGGLIKFPSLDKRPDNYWKILLHSAVQDLVEHRSDERLVFFFDEMPYMIDAVAKRQSEAKAMEILDLCRSLRQSPETGRAFRMVLTGSVGMHHVLDQLRKQGYSNAPLNDMETVEVPPLARADAEDLACRLFAGERLSSTTAADAAAVLADETGCFPYFIHCVVRELSVKSEPAEPESIRHTVQRMLTDKLDKWEMRHFRQRINTYYPDDSKTVLALLDALAAAGPLTVQEVISQAEHQLSVDGERVRDLLRLLQLDHYLDRHDDGRYEFGFALLRRWWRYDRGV